MEEHAYICWILPRGGLVCTERDEQSEMQVRELAEELRSVNFFFNDEDVESK